MIAYNCAGIFRLFKDELSHRFNCKDLGELNKVLNMGIMRYVDGSLFVSQASFVRDVLEHFKEHLPANANSVDLPADPKIRLYAGVATREKGLSCRHYWGA